MTIKMKMISYVGVDRFTNLDELNRFNSDIKSTKNNFELEFGLLYSHTKKDDRYVSKQFIENTIKNNQEITWSIHLCGESVFDFLDKKMKFDIGDTNKIIRVQLNFNLNRALEIYSVGSIKKLAEILNEKIENICKESDEEFRFIIQYNKSKQELFKYLSPEFIDCLFDSSGGVGKIITSMPKILPNFYCGYAGGISPDNVTTIITQITSANSVKNYNYYIDMESGVRNACGEFDIEKCKQIYYKCVDYFDNRKLYYGY